ncbi:MAG: ankyrin repeat domain-containing protein [Pacificimonas sp.]
MTEQGSIKMKWHLAALSAFSLTLAMASPSAAQFSEQFEFFKAVEKGSGAEAKPFMDKPGSTIVNARKRDGGVTALHIVTERRDAPWINFLKQGGADVNLRDDEGNTPLMVAANKRFTDGVQLLLAYGANVNLANNRGETPLIRAVQLKDANSVRMLIAAGANPDQTDHVAGMSARDYATRDRRAAHIVRLLDAAEADTTGVMGPTQ